MGLIQTGMRLSAARLNAGMAAGETGIKEMVATGTMSSSSYVDIPGSDGSTAFTVTKHSSGSKLYVAMTLRAFSDGASTGLRLGVRINGVDYDVAFGYYTQASVYLPVVGFNTNVASGLAAGAYTVQPRWRRTTGSGVINTHSSISELDVSVREVGV